MKKHLLLGLALMAVTCLGGLVYERTAVAQKNSNTAGTTESVKPTGNSNRGRRRHRRTRRRRGPGKTGNSNTQ
jgi:hypothetical protein